MKQLRLMFLITVAVLMLVNCKGHSTVCDSIFNETANYTSAYSLPVENGEIRANLYMEAKLATGAFTWKLRDPNGDIQWEDHYEAANGPELLTFRRFSTPAAGNWHLEMYLQNAIGEYCCVWKTQ